MACVEPTFAYFWTSLLVASWIWASFPSLHFGTRLRVSYVILELDVVHTQLLTGYMESHDNIHVRITASVGWKQGFTQIRLHDLDLSVSLDPVSLGQGKGQVWMNSIYVWQSCVVIEGYSITSSSPPSKCRITELPFVSLSSGVSAPHSPVLFHCEVDCLSLTVWAMICWTSNLSWYSLMAW